MSLITSVEENFAWAKAKEKKKCKVCDLHGCICQTELGEF